MITSDGRSKKPTEPLALQTHREGMFFKAYLWWLAGEREEPQAASYRIEPEHAQHIREHARDLAAALIPSDPPSIVPDHEQQRTEDSRPAEAP